MHSRFAFALALRIRNRSLGATAKFRQTSLICSLAGCVMLGSVAHVHAAALIIGASYDKVFFSSGVLPAATIDVGGVVETWAGTFPVPEFADVDPTRSLGLIYQHASGLTGRDLITNPSGPPFGFPIRTAATVSTGFSGLATVPNDGHDNPNSALAIILVEPLMPGLGPEVKVRDGGGVGLRLLNTVRTRLVGSAIAGVPVDSDPWHSANSAAAVNIVGKAQFKVTDPGAIPTVMEVGSISASADGQCSIGGRDCSGAMHDPYFVTVRDLDTGLAVTQLVMSLTIDAADANYSIDNTGIRLTVRREDPESFVSLSFTNNFAWVGNPYEYGATLSSAGFAAFGLTPLSGWSVTETAETLEAFFAYPNAEMLFDRAIVRPPDGLFTMGHTYAYDDGASAVVFIAAASEPPAILLLLTGVVAFALRRKDQRPLSDCRRCSDDTHSRTTIRCL